ncbi:hypothetical protein GCM10023224_16250 [Streptomonospora halophila]|uniref:Abortive infection C-terminus n=1 Tax=Streptomonospora halophila TaxID=427369 RepID=A0ABP9GBY8_9ACTN
MVPSRDLLNRAARTAVRELVAELAQAAISEYWEDEHFSASALAPEGSSVRRRVFDSYANCVDWSDPDQVARAVRVFERIIRRVDRDRRRSGGALDTDTLADLRENLARDGYRLDQDLRLHPPPRAYSSAAGHGGPQAGPTTADRQITEATRRRVIDTLQLERIWWSGDLDEVDFLERLYDLDALESYDPRFTTARGDISQHCIFNDDWERDWVFKDPRFALRAGPDHVFLAFLAETLHPVVRRNPEEIQWLLALFNQALAPDGFELFPVDAISNRPIFAGGPRASFHGARPDLNYEQRPLLSDPRVLLDHQRRIHTSIENDPAAAISACKELVESLCKIILDHHGEVYPDGDDLTKLYRRVSDKLALNSDSIPEDARASGTVKKILRTLTTSVHGLAEMRNQLGTGHGRSAPSPALARHARLTLNTTIALTEFLLDTWQDRVDRGVLSATAETTESAVLSRHPKH